MILLSILLFLLILISGSFFAFCFFNKSFEEILPITCYSIVVISFFFGFLNILKYSTYFIITISFVLYVISLRRIIKKHINLTSFFSSSFIVFVLLGIYFTVTLFGKYFNAWDEFSHWGDIVKVMCQFNDFGTNPLTTSEFKSYPPGMALFQYFIEQINYIVCGDQFVEWLCNYSYSMLVVSSTFWILSKIKNHIYISSVIYILISIGIPFFFYDYLVFKEVLIDPSLSFILASLMLDVMWSNDDILSEIRIILGVFVIVLLKDTGLMFAIFVFVSYAIKKITTNKTSKKTYLYIALCFLGAIIPKLLWNYEITINNVIVKFSNKIDFNNLLLTITGKEQSYRNETIINYFNAFIEEKFTLENFGANFNYIPIIFVLYLSIIGISNCAIRKSLTSKVNAINVCVELILLSIVFIIGMCVIYMYKFSKEEAVIHASFNRYQRIVLLSLCLYVCYSMLMLLNNISKKLYFILFTLAILAISPIKTVLDFSLRVATNTSISIRNSYKELIDNTYAVCKDDSKIWFISQKDTGFDIRYYRCAVRPNVVLYNSYYLSNGDSVSEFSTEMTPEEWFDTLHNESYGYVALYKVDEAFVNNYYSLFGKKEDIKDNAIYKIDIYNNKLVLCS